MYRGPPNIHDPIYSSNIVQQPPISLATWDMTPEWYVCSNQIIFGATGNGISKNRIEKNGYYRLEPECIKVLSQETCFGKGQRTTISRYPGKVYPMPRMVINGEQYTYFSAGDVLYFVVENMMDAVRLWQSGMSFVVKMSLIS